MMDYKETSRRALIRAGELKAQRRLKVRVAAIMFAAFAAVAVYGVIFTQMESKPSTDTHFSGFIAPIGEIQVPLSGFTADEACYGILPEIPDGNP